MTSAFFTKNQNIVKQSLRNSGLKVLSPCPLQVRVVGVEEEVMEGEKLGGVVIEEVQMFKEEKKFGNF